MKPAPRIPAHPGEVLREEFLGPLGLSADAFAAHIGVSPAAIESLLREETPVAPDLAWLLAMAVGTTPQLWMNLQVNHDLALHRPRRRLPRLAPTG